MTLAGLSRFVENEVHIGQIQAMVFETLHCEIDQFLLLNRELRHTRRRWACFRQIRLDLGRFDCPDCHDRGDRHEDSEDGDSRRCRSRYATVVRRHGCGLAAGRLSLACQRPRRRLDLVFRLTGSISSTTLPTSSGARIWSDGSSSESRRDLGPPSWSSPGPAVPGGRVPCGPT